MLFGQEEGLEGGKNLKKLMRPAALVSCQMALSRRYWQNCAARGLCDNRYHLREESSVHQAPEGPRGGGGARAVVGGLEV